MVLLTSQSKQLISSKILLLQNSRKKTYRMKMLKIQLSKFIFLIKTNNHFLTQIFNQAAFVGDFIITFMQSKASIRSFSEIFQASVISSFLSTIITNPIEVAKLNLQYFPLNCQYYPHKNYWTLIRCQCSRFSISGSLRSLKVALPQVLFSNMIFMQLYQQIRQTLIKHSNLPSAANTLLASLTARMAVVSLMLPLQSLRIRLSNQRTDRSINFHGFKITVARDLIFSGLYWTALEGYRNRLVEGEYRQKLAKDGKFTWSHMITNMLPGFLLGMLVAGVTTPMDTLKTRVQTKGIQKYSIIKGISQIYKKEGYTGLFSGVQWRMLKSGLHSSLYLAIYEWWMQRVSFNDLRSSGNSD